MSLSPNAARNGNNPTPPTTYRRLSLKRNILWTGIGTAVYYVAQYALSSLITKLTNSVTFGQFSLALAVITPVILFSQMQFRSLQVTDAKGEYSFQDYFWTRFYGTVCALLVIAFMAFTGNFSPEVRAVIILFGLAKCFESLGDLTYGTLQSNDRMDYVTISQTIKSLLSIVLFGGVLYLTRQLMPAILVLGGAWALVFFGFDLPFARKVSGTKSLFAFPSPAVVRQLVVLSLPLALTATMNSYLINLPRYELKPFGESAIAHFSAVASLINMVVLITSTVSQATLARISRYYQEGEYRAYLRLAARTALLQTGISLAFTLLVFVGGKGLVGTLFTSEYREYTNVLLLMCAGMTLNSLGAIASLTLTGGRHFRQQVIYTVVLLLLCFPLYHYLIARYGVIGAGWAEFGKYVLGGIIINIIAFPMLRDLWRGIRAEKEIRPV